MRDPKYAYQPTPLEKLEMLLDLLELRMLLHPDPKGGVEHHTHQCKECNQLWDHSDNSFGDEKAHKCPHCDAGPFWDRVR